MCANENCLKNRNISKRALTSCSRTDSAYKTKKPILRTKICFTLKRRFKYRIFHGVFETVPEHRIHNITQHYRIYCVKYKNRTIRSQHKSRFMCECIIILFLVILLHYTIRPNSITTIISLRALISGARTFWCDSHWNIVIGQTLQNILSG